MMRSPGSAAVISSQAANTSAGSAMSAMEQPAAMLGRITATSGGVRMSADSAMKCTPQKSTYAMPSCAAAWRASLKLSPVWSA